MRSDVEGARDLAREAAALLLRLSAYDYALAGTLTGAKTHVVSTPRYTSVMRDSAATIQRFTGNALNATLNSSGPLRDRLVTLADELVEVSRASTRYVDGGDPAAFADVVAGVKKGWEAVHNLARVVRPVDQDLLATIERGSSITVGAAAQTVYGLYAGPFASAGEASEAAQRIGKVEEVSQQAPFVVRVGTYVDKPAGDSAFSALSGKGFTGLLNEEKRFKFTRSGPTPDAELWREPERVIETWGGSRRVAIASGGAWVVTGADDGTIAVFSGDGQLLSLPRQLAGIAQLAFSDDGKWFMAGGITLVNYSLPRGVASGDNVRMPTPTTELLFVPGTTYFAAVSKGSTGGNGAIAARWPDGAPLPHPFSVQLPESGGVLAATGAGELWYGWNAGAETEIDVIQIARQWAVQGVMRVPGAVSDLAVSRDGAHGAVMTDKGVYRFGPHAPDPKASLLRVSDPVREIAMGADGTLYLLAQTKITAVDPRGETVWSASLVDGREVIVAGSRPVVLDGADRVLTFTASGDLEDLGSSGTVQAVAVSPDGKRIAALVDFRRVEIFKLP